MEGHEGVYFDGKMLQFDAQQDVDISSSLSKEIVFDAANGVHFGDRLPLSQSGSPASELYKLCACINTGQLFRVKVTSKNSTCVTARGVC